MSREEYQVAGGSQGQFELSDKNHDGMLDSAELQNSDDLIARVLSRQKVGRVVTNSVFMCVVSRKSSSSKLEL